MICGFARLVTKPLFPGYFFAQFCPLLSYEAVRYAHGVLRVVGDSRFPIPVKPEVIASIRARVQADGFIRLQAKPFMPGDSVTIGQGPLAGWIGRVERESDDGKRVAILLGVLKQARMLVRKCWLQPIEAV
jgi:transcription antitermination factor NusG